MTTKTNFPKPTLSFPQLVLFVAIAFLAVMVEVLILRAILNSSDSIDHSRDSSVAITTLANVQREALLLQIETEQLLHDPSVSVSPLQLRRSLLENQLRVQDSRQWTEPGVQDRFDEIRLSLATYDKLFKEFSAADVTDSRVIALQMKSVLSSVDTQVKAIYDLEEQGLFLAASDSLLTQRNSQFLMLSVGGLVMVLGGMLAFSLRRSFRDLWKEMGVRAKAEEAEHHRNLELETLFEIAGILVKPGPFQERCRSVLDRLARILDADLATLRVLDESGQILQLLAQAGPAPWRQADAISLQSVSGIALQRGEPVAANDYASHPLAHGAEIERGIKSMVSVPINTGGQNPLAILNVVSRQPDHFTSVRMRLLAAVGDGLGGLLDHAKLSQDLETSLLEMAGVDEVARIITSTLNIEEAYNQFTSEMKKLVNFDQGYINLVDHKTGEYSVQVLYGVEQAAAGAETSSVPEGSQLQEVMDSRETLVRADIEPGPRMYNDLAHMHMGMRSSITVPMITKGLVVGALELWNRRSAAFGPREQSVLERLARHMAPAVENARLFEQTRMEEAKATTALSQLWAVLDGVDAGIMLANDDQEVLWANRQFGEFFGFTGQELVLAATENGQPPNPENKLWFADPSTLGNGEPNAGEDKWYVGPAGEIEVDYPSPRTLQRYSTPVNTGEGQPLGRLWVYYDISEQRRLESQIIQSQKMETVGRLAGGVAHDFNNMLSVITINAELAMRHNDLNDSLSGNLEDITQATQRAANLTRQLLIFSRRQVLEPKVLDLNDLVLDLYKMLRQLIGENIEFVVPTSTETCTVKVDPSQLEQVLMNLAINASDAMPEGGKFTIATSNVSFEEDSPEKPLELAPGDYVALLVSDTGSGISGDDQVHIFEPFFTTKESGKGTGLGLATCYGIITQSNGHIEVQSEIGQGTSFSIYLPRVDDWAVMNVDSVKSTPLPKGSETVLVVEDEPMVLSTAVQVLNQQGYTVLQASNGEEGLRVAQNHSEGEIHLLLTDSVMPKMGGVELAEKLRELRPKIKVLFTSGYMDYDYISLHHGEEERGVSFIQKPLTPDSLSRKVREVLELQAA